MYWTFSIINRKTRAEYIGSCKRIERRTDGSEWSEASFIKGLINQRISKIGGHLEDYDFSIHLITESRAEARQLRKLLILTRNDNGQTGWGNTTFGGQAYIDTTRLLTRRRSKEIVHTYQIRCMETGELFRTSVEAGIANKVRGNSILFAISNKGTSNGCHWEYVG